MVRFEICFDDLTPEAQRRLMDSVGIERPEEANWDIPGFPLVILELEEDI